MKNLKKSQSSMTFREFFNPDYLCHEKLKIRKHKNKEYLNVSASFDIEDTSFYDADGNKASIMYCFVFGLNGKVIFGRTWKDLFELLKALRIAYNLSESRILPVYVHNLSHEFSFICKRFTWVDIFATAPRTPIRALTNFGVEFRDSYILSGQSLAGTCKNLHKYKIEKLKGDLDYSLLRHSKTILTPKEWHYVENDGLGLMSFIQEEIERNNDNVTTIPMTKTGYVRKYMKNQCYHNGQKGHGERRRNKTRDFSNYRKIMKILTLTPQEYILAKESFQGGFTHSNSFNVGIIFNDVASYDLTSAYPAVMALCRYPMGTGNLLNDYSPENVKFHLKNYACIFRIRIWKIKSRFKGDNFLSYSKCRNAENVSLDNGRVLKADYLETSMTDIDLEIIHAFYSMERIEIFDLWYYPRGYLPKNFIKGVLGLYADKTTLKGVEGEEVNYHIKKELLNSTYGCSVTDIQQPVNKYENGEWITETPDLEEVIKKYNDSTNRFLFYLWGVFVTAHVRRIIAKSILELGDDYIYSDTDSVKFINPKKHEKYFEDFNADIKAKIALSSRFNNIPLNLYIPKTKDGIEKPIGVFDNEGDEETGICYKRFKTLGAKRYFVEYPEPHKFKTRDGKEIETPFNLTISGVNKNQAIPELVKKAEKEKKDIFEYFEIGFLFDSSMCGKITHTYCDYPIKGKLEDYRGVVSTYSELSFVHLEATTYKLTTTEEFYENIYMDKLKRIIRREKIIT